MLASASRVRQHHSVATLLPDGPVMTGGGGSIAKICLVRLGAPTHGEDQRQR